MAIADLTNSQLQLVFNDGTDTSTGQPIYVTKSFNNVKPAATADQLHAIAVAFVGLQERNLYTIHRRDSSEIRQG